jgi:hypothetical protein
MVPTSNTPLDQLDTLWAKHWFWRRYCCNTSTSNPNSRSHTLSSGLGSMPLSPWSVRPGSSPASTEQMLQQLAYLHLARLPDSYHAGHLQQQQQHGSAAGSAAAADLHSPRHGSWQFSWGGTVGSPGGSSDAGGSSNAGLQQGRGLLVDAAMFQQLSMHTARNLAAAGSSVGSPVAGPAAAATVSDTSR